MFRRSCRVLIFLFFISMPIPSILASSNEHKIVKLSNTAWVTRSGLTNRASVNTGDTLKNGDSLETLRGNTAVIRLDADPKNLIYVSEETALTVDDSEGGLGLKVFRGKVAVSAQSLEPLRTFRVTSPTAVAVVRGTQFQIAVTPSVSTVLGYSGTVEVKRRMPDGSVSKDSVLLQPGERVEAKEGVVEPLKTEAMTSGEIAGAKEIFQTLTSMEGPVPEFKAQGTPAQNKKEEQKDDVIVDSYIVSSEDQEN